MSSQAVLCPPKSKEQDATASDYNETTSTKMELIPNKLVLALQELLAQNFAGASLQHEKLSTLWL